MKLFLLSLLLSFSACRDKKKYEDPPKPEDYEEVVGIVDFITEYYPTHSTEFVKSYNIGLEASGFTKQEMPFKSGMVKASSIKTAPPLVLLWEKRDSYVECQLLIETNTDGVYLKSTSSCIPL